MKKLSIAIGLSLGVLATPPGLADSPIDTASDVLYPVIDLQEANISTSTRASQSEYNKGYKAGLSKCDATYSPSDGNVHIPCIEVAIEGETIMYKVDMQQINGSLEQFLFSVTNTELVQ